MKRVKILLTGLAMVTAVGVGLAFKAQKFGNVKLWTSNAENQCRFVLAITFTDISPEGTVYYTLAGFENYLATTTCTATTYTKTTSD